MIDTAVSVAVDDRERALNQALLFPCDLSRSTSIGCGTADT